MVADKYFWLLLEKEWNYHDNKFSHKLFKGKIFCFSKNSIGFSLFLKEFILLGALKNKWNNIFLLLLPNESMKQYKFSLVFEEVFRL